MEPATNRKSMWTHETLTAYHILRRKYSHSVAVRMVKRGWTT